MPLLVVGVSHHTSSFDLLEQLGTMPTADVRGGVMASSQVAEVMVLSTCNRVEVYAQVGRFHEAVEDIVAVMAKESGLTVGELTAHCYVHFDQRAVQHVFEVTAGLDSMVAGEDQIQGQVRSSFLEAKDASTAGRELHDLAQAALRAGKAIRSSTEIASAGASVVSVGIGAALRELAGASPKAAVVGSGSMSGLAVASLGRLDIPVAAVIGRNSDQAKRLAGASGSVARPFTELAATLAEVDLVVTCTGATEVLIDEAMVRAAMATRGERPLVILDLALPHDSDPAVGAIAGVTRIDLAALAQRTDSAPDRASLRDAKQLLAAELTRFEREQAAREVEPLVLKLRAQATEVVDEELRKLRLRLRDVSEEDWLAVEQAMRRTVATLLHTPTVRVKQLAADADGRQYAQALTSLFDLPVDVVDTVVAPRDLPAGREDLL